MSDYYYNDLVAKYRGDNVKSDASQKVEYFLTNTKTKKYNPVYDLPSVQNEIDSTNTPQVKKGLNDSIEKLKILLEKLTEVSSLTNDFLTKIEALKI